MAWMSDEHYVLYSDIREKKSIAASAHKQRTHCGKGGSVKFPSDYLTKKEIKAMSGECKTYRTNEPLSWEEFVEWPNEHKVTYITGIRDKFGASDEYIAEMFNVSCMMLGMWFKDLGMESKNDCNENWNKEKFYAWRSGANTDLVEEGPDLTKPMSCEEFKKLSDENKIIYIQGIRKQFGAPDVQIAHMFPVAPSAFAKITKGLGINVGKSVSGRQKWDKDGFLRWSNSQKKEAVEETLEETVEETVDIPVSPEVEEPAENTHCDLASDCMKKKIYDAGPIAFAGNSLPVIPKHGTMTFECNNADDILKTLKSILSDVKVNLTVSWECV